MKKPVLIISALAVAGLLLIGVLAAVYFFVIAPNLNKVTNSLITGTVTPTSESSTATETPTASNSNASSACNVLTKDIAETVLNVKVAETPGNTDNSCTYLTADTTYGDISILTIVISKTSTLEAKSQFDTARTTIYNSETVSVSGLSADDAYWATNLQQLSILKGDKWILLSGISSKNTDSKALTIQAAKLALVRI